MFEKLKCKHEHLQTVSNIHGDAINFFKRRSIVRCLDCGKEFIK